MSLANGSRIEAAVVDRVKALTASATDAFADAAAAPEVVELKRDLATTLVDLVAARVARCAALLDAAN